MFYLSVIVRLCNDKIKSIFVTKNGGKQFLINLELVETGVLFTRFINKMTKFLVS